MLSHHRSQLNFGTGTRNSLKGCNHGRVQRGDRGSGPTPPPLKNHKNIGFRSNTGPNPLHITKLLSGHSMLGHHRDSSEPPFLAFCWLVDDGPFIAVFVSYIPLSTKTKKRYQMGTCIKGIFWPPMRSKNKSCSSQLQKFFIISL